MHFQGNRRYATLKPFVIISDIFDQSLMSSRHHSAITHWASSLSMVSGRLIWLTFRWIKEAEDKRNTMLFTLKTDTSRYTTSRACYDIMACSNTTARFLLLYSRSITVPIGSFRGTTKRHDTQGTQYGLGFSVALCFLLWYRFDLFVLSDYFEHT